MNYLIIMDTDDLTVFHRNHYIISISDFKNEMIFKKGDLQNNNHITLKTIQKLFPNISDKKMLKLIMTSIQMKVNEGINDFIFAANDDNTKESLDLVNAILLIFNFHLKENKYKLNQIKRHKGKWTRLATTLAS